MDKFIQSQFGQATLAFLRVFTVTLVASWLNAGLPISHLAADTLLGWLELAAQAAATLVIVNYVAPWEKRYGLSKGLPAAAADLPPRRDVPPGPAQQL